MSYISYKAGITLDGGFKLDSAQPLDVRFVVAKGEKKNDLLASSCYAGMEVWDANDNKKYRAIPDGTSFVWKEVGTKEDVPDIDLSNKTITLAAGNGLTDGGAFTLNQVSDETITFNVGAGNGITVTENAVAAKAGNGITVDATGINHGDTSTLEGSYGPSDGGTQEAKKTLTITVPQITVDGYGHVTAVANKTFTVTDTDTDTDTGATSVETIGEGNAVTIASYSADTRKLTLTKGSTFLTEEKDTLQTVTGRGATTPYGITLGTTTPLTFTGAGAETYTLSVMYCRQSDGIIFETPRATDSATATILPFNIMTRGGQYAPLNSGAITSNNTVNAYGFVHSGVTAPEGKTKDDYVLLAGGSTKPLSEFGIGTGGSLDLSNYVDKTTEQTISGAKTFTGSNIFTNESKFTHATYAPTWVDIASGIGKSSCFTRGAFMQLITGQILLPNAACNNTSAGVTGGYETESGVLKFQTMTAASGQPTVATVASINNLGITTKALTLTSTDGIAYSDGTNKINMIKFITGASSGHGIVVGGNGAVIIGAGESASNIQTALGINGNTEYLYLSADEDVEFYSDCNANSGGDRKQSIYRQSGDWDLYGKTIAQGFTIADGTDLASRTKRATWQYNSSTDCVELVW